MLSSGAKTAFVSAQSGDSIKTLETHYAKYIPDAETEREMVEKNILEGVTLAKPRVSELAKQLSPTPPQRKKPSTNQGLKNGAGEEGRTPDLMLGKHTL